MKREMKRLCRCGSPKNHRGDLQEFVRQGERSPTEAAQFIGHATSRKGVAIMMLEEERRMWSGLIRVVRGIERDSSLSNKDALQRISDEMDSVLTRPSTLTTFGMCSTLKDHLDGTKTIRTTCGKDTWLDQFVCGACTYEDVTWRLQRKGVTDKLKWLKAQQPLWKNVMIPFIKVLEDDDLSDSERRQRVREEIDKVMMVG